MSEKRFLLTLLAVVVLLLTACTVAPAPAEEGAAGEGEAAPAASAEGPVTLDYNLSTEPPTLDPSLATDTTSSAVIKSTFLGLTELDPETMEAMPMLATSWEANEDSTVWTFTLRDDVPWVMYDGSEVVEVTDDSGEVRMVTAADVVYGVTRTCDAATASDYAYILYIITGCEAANTGEGSPDDVSVEALDDYTVQFTLEYGAGFFPQIISMPVAFAMPQWVIEEAGDGWTEAGTIVNNGPFVLAEWVHNDSMQLVRNPLWFGWDERDNVGNIEVLDFVMIEEASTAFAMYENSELDYASVPLEQMDRVFYAEDSEFADQAVQSPDNCTYYYGFVTEKEAVSDPNVRRALSMAVDRTTLSDAILKGGQIPANAFTNPANFGSAAGDTDVAPWALGEDAGGTGYEAALEMAKELMAEAGYPDGEGLSLTIGHNVSESHAKIAQAIQAMWTAAFPGIQVTIETQEWGVYLDSLELDAPLEGKPDVFRLGWCMDYPHANNWMHEVFNPDAGANRIMLSADDEQIGDLVAEYSETTYAAQTASPEEQMELYKRAEQLLIDEIAAIVPIYYYTFNGVAKPWLTRVYSSDPYFYLWSIDADAKAAR